MVLKLMGTKLMILLREKCCLVKGAEVYGAFIIL